MLTFPITEDSELDCLIDLSSWLQDGEIISLHTVSKSSEDFVISSSSIVNDSTAIQIWFRGASLDDTAYLISTTIQTSSTPARAETFTVKLEVVNYK